MSVQIIDFDFNYIKEAAGLLQNVQRNQFKQIGFSYDVSLETCEEQIILELKKEVSSSHMLKFEDRIVGFAIATINKDDIWGASGWVNLGAWCIEPEFRSYLPFLYQKIAEAWVKKKISQHYFMIFDFDKNGMELLNSLGFAKEQTHALLSLSAINEFKPPEDPYVYRKSNENDQIEMNGFSRLIAEYQTQSPCFAPAPQKYLEALDEGFSDITANPEIDLFVVQDGDRLAGYQGYYDTEQADLIIPPKTVELSVSGVKKEYRHQGCGLNMTLMSLNAQRKQGYRFAVTDWRCANLLSSNFWEKVGFIPVAHRLTRRVDHLL